MAMSPDRHAPEPASAGAWPRWRSATLDWLIGGTRRDRFFDRIFVELCERLVDEGVPLSQATMHLRIAHPEFTAITILWRRGRPDPEVVPVSFAAADDLAGFERLFTAFDEGATALRQTFGTASQTSFDHVWLESLRPDGLRERVALPLDFTDGRRHVLTVATASTSGLSAAHADLIGDLLPAFALVTEIRLKNRLAGRLLETYVGTLARDEILGGATRRGHGHTLSATVLFADLRDFTSLSDTLQPDAVLDLLNDFFDAVTTPVLRHGGEVLKFTGDGILAVFPTATVPRVEVVAAVAEARANIHSLNASRAASHHEVLRYGIGVHTGEVSYGNVGSRSRLDFTAIGLAVNVAARLEGLTKALGHEILFSGSALSGLEPSRFVALGPQRVRGVADLVEVYALT